MTASVGHLARQRARPGICALGLLGLLASPLAAGPLLVWNSGPIGGPGFYHHAFELREDATIRVQAVGAGSDDLPELHIYGWILDARTRDVVWQMTRENTVAAKQADNRVADSEIDLSAGRYVAYFSALGRHYPGRKTLRLWKYRIGQLKALTGEFYPWDAFGDPARWRMRLDVADSDFDPKDLVESDEHVDSNAFIRFAPLGNEAYETQTFEVTRPVQVEIAGTGEYDSGRDNYVDRAWLAEARSGDLVWEMRVADAEPAGGAAKNHRFHTRLSLAEGQYVFGVLTDDSHAAGDWNEAPPFDPDAWGAELDVAEGDREAVRTLRDTDEAGVIARIDRVGNSSFVRSAFETKRPIHARVVGLGEAHFQDRYFADYGWIERLPDRSIVWTMRGKASESAGGHPKNRKVVDRIDLPPGTYVLCYLTDDSHAYGSWNTSPPNNPAQWGIALYSDDPDVVSAVKRVEVEDVDPAIISLIATGDNTHRKQTMVLARPYRLKIVALGEGIDGKMYDYGWIENVATQETVWKMNYDDTRSGGGDPKNRLVEATIDLGPGEYRVHYRTDDSHSFESFNVTPPDRPELWGISIYVASETSASDIRVQGRPVSSKRR